MLVLDLLFPDVQQLLPGQVGVHLDLLGLIAPHAFLDSQAQLFLLDAFALAQLVQFLLVLLGQVLPFDHLLLLSDGVLHKGGVLFEEGLFEKDRLITQYQSHCSFLGGFENRVLDDYAIPFLDLLSEFGVVAVNCPATGGDGALAWFRLIPDHLAFRDDILLLLVLFLVRLSDSFWDVGRLDSSFLELEFADFEAAHL